jgi:DNA polymerase
LGKSDSYAELVAERVACRRCAGLTNPCLVDDGAFDSPETGPWSRWQGNLDADLMVVGQDWGDDRYFRKHSGLEGPSNPTNDALRELIQLLGIDVGPPGDLRRGGVAFFTNAILCLKVGGLQAAVDKSWFGSCSDFLRRQVEIVSPRVVVCLGQQAYWSLCDAFQLPRTPFRAAVESHKGVTLSNGSRAFARYHCGRRIQNTHRPLEVQREDWLRLREFL